MKRHTEFLVRKRDGRLEWLRATKLARSIRHAFGEQEVIADDAILCLTETILTAWTTPAEDEMSAAGESPAPISTSALAEAVEHTLRCLGRADAAERYASERRSRGQRRALLDDQCDALSASIEGPMGTALPTPGAAVLGESAPDRREGLSPDPSLDNDSEGAETSSMPESLARHTPKTRSSR